MSAADEQARRAARASWPGLKTSLAEAPGAEDLRAAGRAKDLLDVELLERSGE